MNEHSRRGRAAVLVTAITSLVHQALIPASGVHFGRPTGRHLGGVLPSTRPRSLPLIIASGSQSSFARESCLAARPLAAGSRTVPLGRDGAGQGAGRGAPEAAPATGRRREAAASSESESWRAGASTPRGGSVGMASESAVDGVRVGCRWRPSRLSMASESAVDGVRVGCRRRSVLRRSWPKAGVGGGRR
jgi:hypothetical protein